MQFKEEYIWYAVLGLIGLGFAWSFLGNKIITIILLVGIIYLAYKYKIFEKLKVLEERTN